MKVYVHIQDDPDALMGVSLTPQVNEGDFVVEQEVEGAENMVLVDREELRHVLEHHGAAGSRSNWCNWPGCGWAGEGTEHSTCPLREEA